MGLGSKGNNGSRGRPYGMMLLLAFGAAVLGFMVLHKLRERRIFTLLIQDKDQHLITLHLLLQKERESTKELKRKFEDLKTKYVLVRTEKQAMKSITTSLKQEQRSLESKLEEKQDEINMLLHSTPSENSLKQILKQKEEEIQEMKRLLEKQITVWSVTTDDPSNSPVLPVLSDKTAGNFVGEEPNVNSLNLDVSEASINVTEGSELKKINGGQIHKLEKGQDGEDLGQMDNAGEKNSGSNVSGDEVTSFTSHRDDTEGEGNNKEHGIKLQVPEKEYESRVVRGKDGRKLKKLNKSGMKRGGRLNKNDSVEDRERNTFAVDHHISSEFYGKRKFKIFENSKDEGSSDTVYLKETEQRAVSKQGNLYTKQQLGRELDNQQTVVSRESSSEFW